MKQKKEKEIQKEIKDYLLWLDHYVLVTNNVGVMKPNGSRIPSNTPGMSDILGVHKDDGGFIAIEVKTPKGKTTENQKEFLREIRKRHGYAFVATSIQDVEKALNDQRFG